MGSGFGAWRGGLRLQKDGAGNCNAKSCPAKHRTRRPDTLNPRPEPSNPKATIGLPDRNRDGFR